MKALVIEDSEEVVELIRLCFKLRSPEVTMVATGLGQEGVELVETESPDIVILDLGLPDIDGFDVLRQIRQFSDVPIVILTVRDAEMDVVRGLEFEADDYIVKPFKCATFLARINNALRRASTLVPRSDSKPLLKGNLSIDLATRVVKVHEKPVRLSPKEFGLLYQLARNEGKVLSNSFLVEQVWGENYADATDYVKDYIYRLREKLGDDPANPRMIVSIRGWGYKFVKQV